MAAGDPNIYFDASFGGIPILIAEIDTEHGRDVATQSPSRGDKHVRQDRGRRALDATVEILFLDQPGLDPYTSRYERFRNLVNAGDAQIFSHPLDGSYRARAGDLRVRAGADLRQISCSCTILAEDEPQTTFPAGAGTTPVAGLESVTTAVADANAQLATLGLTSAVPDACSTAVTGWSVTDGLDSNAVFVAVATLTGEISTAIDALDLATDLSRWAAYQAFVNLAFQVSRAGEAFTSSSEHLFQITVTKPLPLLAICASIYGAAAAQDEAAQVAQINRVRTPGRVPKGTVLKMPPVPS